MISLFIKYWKLLVDILIVIALCVAFSYFDPFHMFRKAHLEQTANMVSSIKAIGELVTAEYYGEVISFEGDTLPLTEDNVTDSIKHFYRLMVTELDQIPGNSKRGELTKAISQVITTLRDANRNLYPAFMAFIAHKHYDKRIEKYIEQDAPIKLKSGVDADLCRDIRDELLNKKKQLEKNYATELANQYYTDYLNELPGYLYDFYDFYSQGRFAGKKANDKEQVILIARGTVKAGFNFGTLDERNFLYDAPKKQIRLYGLSAQILDTVINPWFIPERKVPGYEFVNNPKTTDYAQVLAAKNNCRLKLTNNACQAGLLEQAQQNGKEVIRNFFSVLLNQPDLTVSFNEMPGNDMMKRITRDSVITADEAVEFSQLLERYRLAMETATPNERANMEFECRILVNQIKNCRFILTGKPFHLFDKAFIDFEKLSQNVAMLNDSTCIYRNDTLPVNKLIRTWVSNIRDTLREIPLGKMLGYSTGYLTQNPYWYADTSIAFITDFNSTLTLFQQKYPEITRTEYFYPEVGFSGALFDTLNFTQWQQVDSTIEKIIVTRTFVLKQEKDTLRLVECHNAKYYVQTSPIKKFSKFIQKQIHKNNEP